MTLRARGWTRGAVGAGMVLLAAAGWALLARSAAAPPTTIVHREDLAVTVEAAGELDAVRSSLIGPPFIPNVWEFKIAYLIPESRQVRSGEPILRFDTTAMDADLQKRRTDFDVATKALEKGEADLAIRIADLEALLDEAGSRLGKNSLKADRPDELAGMVDLKLAKLDRELDEKEIASLRARIEGARGAGDADREGFTAKRDFAAGKIREIEESIAKMKIGAPQDGIVIYQADWNGDKKKIGDTVWAAAKVLKIPDLTEMMGRGDVDEADAGRLAPGQSVTMRLDALPDAEVKGKLQRIGRVVQLAGRGSTLKVYKVEFSLDRTDQARMRPGMRLRADIEVDRKTSALVVPREAIFLRAGGPVVVLESGGRLEERTVRLGARNSRLVEILDGLAAGDRISLRDPSSEREAAGSRGAGS